jgi:hypothetical protein
VKGAGEVYGWSVRVGCTGEEDGRRRGSSPEKTTLVYSSALPELSGVGVERENEDL